MTVRPAHYSYDLRVCECDGSSCERCRAHALTDLGQQLGNDLHTLDAIIIRVTVALLRGQIDTAADHLRHAEELTGADKAVRRTGLAVMRGWIAAAGGGLQEALGAPRPVVEGASQSHAFWPVWPCWNGIFFEFATLAGDREFSSSSCLGIAETAAARNPGVASFEGVALNLRGRTSKDLDVIAQSADVLARSPRPVLRAWGADTYGRALLAAGARTAGLAQLDRAWDGYHEMGAVVSRAEVQRVMREAGARHDKWSSTVKRPTPMHGWI